ncbi:hypothetical protein PM082_000597 [Marasmius tenuissimus]|nr:hypothetical protein PM082_000597 [Marasmius tenuissimus]
MPVQWNSPTEIGRDAISFQKYIYILIGLYGWEWFMSLDFDYKVVTGKHKFKWHFIIYFINRYATLVGMIVYGVVLNVRGGTDKQCNTLWTVIQTMGHLSVGTANVMLSVRAMAVWKHNLYVVVGVSFILLGYWGVLLRDIVIFGARWEDDVGCIITIAETNYVMGVFIYAMVVDFIILCLMGSKTGIRMDNRTRLINILFIDGLMYFILAFAVSLTAVIFSVLNLNPVLSLAGWVPSVLVTSIAACRAVRHLSNFAERDGNYPSMSRIRPSALSFRVSVPQRTQTRQAAEASHLELDTKSEEQHSEVTTEDRTSEDDTALQNDPPQPRGAEAV